MAKVSIIIPVYNSGMYLKKCLDSVCRQSLEDIEIIILNDASVDNSLDIINSFAEKDSRIIVINFEKNVGPGVLRNLGIEIASSEYIGFIDSDDYIEPNMFSILYDKIKQTDSDIAICGHIPKIYGIDYKKILLKLDRKLENEYIIEPKNNPSFLNKQTVACWNKLYKHDFIQKFRFPEHLKFEDYPMVINMLGSANRIFTTEKSLYNYRIRPNSLTTIDSKVFKPNTLDIFECNNLIKKYYMENGLLSIFQDSLNCLFFEHAVFKLIPMVSVSMPFLQKKRLINYYINLLDIEFNGWEKSEYYQYLKEHSIRLEPYMYLIDKFFVDDNLRTENSSEKVKQKIIDLCSK